MCNRSAALAFLFVAVLMAAPAHAHGAFGSAAPFWSGVFHFAVSPLAIVAALAFTFAIVQVDDHAVLVAIGIAALGAFIAAQWAPPMWMLWVPAAPIAAGLFSVSGLPAGRRTSYLLAAISGVAIGVASEPDVRTLGVAFGVSVMVVVLASAGIELFLWLTAQRWRSAVMIGRRVLGAWMAAIGLLLGALAVFAPG